MLHHNADLSDGLLKTDIALIAADEEYAVFAIRIPRAMLAKNHFFLNVVSDLAGGTDDRGQICPPDA